VIGLSYLTCKYSRVCFIQITCLQQDATTMYFYFVVDSDIDVCFLLDHVTRHFPRNNAPSLVLFVSSILPAQSASIYEFKVNYFVFGYHNPKSKVACRYIIILFTSFK
jgi:hypothetical protein